MRLDTYLAMQHQITSRQKAQELIKKGAITINGKIILKPAYEIDSNMSISINTDQLYVSRAAFKLKGFLQDHPNIHIQEKKILDIGSSTGGFAQILLEYGAACVVCVDVGTMQLHTSLRKDERIIVHEQTDIRNFYAEAFELVTCDVSFISLTHLIEPITRLCSKEAIILFKPQFEVGKVAKRNAKGVVIDTEKSQKTLEAIITQFEQQGFNLQNTQVSQLKGKEGNEETFVHFTR